MSLGFILSICLAIAKLGETVNLSNCTFTDGLCQWVNEVNDEFDWIRGNSCTPTHSTGPCADHTSDNQGTYLYIETSYPRRHGDRALLSLNATGGNCLSFWYHMWGVGLGELNVYYKESQMTAPQLAWHMQGNQGNLWKFAQVSFNGYNAETVAIEGIRGSGYHGDIGIDDVELSQETWCPGTVEGTDESTESYPDTVEGIPLRKIAHWRFDGGETDVRDAMYVNDGGRTVLYFNGATQTTVHAMHLGNSGFTLALWIKPMLGTPQYLLSAEKQFYLHLNRQGRFMAKFILDNGDEFGPYGVLSVHNNTWTHVAVTWNETSKTMSMFMDAALVLKMRVDLGLTKEIANDYWLGWREYRSNMVFRGLMRDLQIFTKALDEAEVRSIKGPFCDQLCLSPGVCDHWTGKCLCGNLKHVNKWCRNALNSTIYNEAVVYYPMDTSSGLLNLKSDQEIIGVDEKHVTIGPVNLALRLDRLELEIGPYEVPCLSRPERCNDGFSLAFWINVLELYRNNTYLLSRSIFGGESSWGAHTGATGARGVKFKVFTRGTRKIFQISVTTNQRICEIQFKFNASTWMHVTVTWYDGVEMYLFLNGVKQYPGDLERSLCQSKKHGGQSSLHSFILGSTEAIILLDDVALWDRTLYDGEVNDIYYTVIGGVMKNVTVEAKFIHEIWYEELQDPESKRHLDFKYNLLWNLWQLFEDEGLYDLEINQLRAGSVVANFTLMFRTLTSHHIRALEEVLFINKYLGNMAITNVKWQFGDQIPQEAPNIAHVTILNETSVEITWEGIPFESFAGAPQGYMVLYYENATAHVYKPAAVVVPGLVNFTRIEGLQANTNYFIQVLAVNVFAAGPLSDPVMMKTPSPDTVPSLPPKNLTAVSTGPHLISVSWSPVSFTREEAPVLGYDIYWKRLSDNFTSQFKSKTLEPAVNITSLQVYTWYQVTVAAYNSRGSGPNSSHVNVRTQDNARVRPVPQNITVTARNSTSVTVEWLTVSRQSQHPYNYTVLWVAVKRGLLGVTTNVTVSVTSFIILGLDPYTKYVIRVAVRDWNETGRFSNPLCVHTLEGVPSQPPQNVTVHKLTSNSLQLTWSPVFREFANGRIQGYRVKVWSLKPNGLNVTMIYNTTSALIGGLRPNTKYMVQVSAFTSAGKGNSTSLSVITHKGAKVLLPPENVTASVTSSTSVNVQWSPVSRTNNSQHAFNYTVQWFSVKNGRENFTVASTSYIIQGLAPFTTYKVRVAAMDWDQIGNFSNAVQVQTLEGVPSQPPQNVTVHNLSSNSFLLTWDPVLQEFANGRIQGYRVRVWELRLWIASAKQNVTTVGNTVTSALIGGLKADTRYIVHVSAFTSAGEGNNNQIDVTTDEGVPTRPPQHVQGINQSSTSLLITWGDIPAGYAHGNVIGYNVYVNNVSRQLITSVRTIVLTGLNKYTPYTVQISANTSKGEGPRSQPITVWTDEDVPCDPPSNIAVNDVTATTVTVQWTYQSNCSVPGFIRGYRLMYGVVPSSPVFLQVTGENNKAVVLMGLRPYSIYHIRLQVMTATGRDGRPSTVWVRTHEGVPSRAPPGLEPYMVWERDIFLRWSSVPPEYEHGIIRGFKVFYHDKGSATQVAVIEGAGKRLCALSGLKPFTEYQVRILAYTSAGDGVKSPSIRIATEESVPSAPPTNVTVVEKTSTTSLSIHWMKVPDNETNGHLTGYVVSYQAVKIGGKKVVNEVVKKRTVGAGTFSLMIDDLQSFTTYEIRVAGLTRRGEGVYSQPVNAETCHCDKRLTTNCWSYAPYVISSSANNMSGIFMAFLDKMVLHCCGDCSKGHGTSIMDYNLDGNNNPARKNTEEEMRVAIDSNTDLSLPVYGFSDQRKYMSRFRFVPVVESPGAAFIVTKEGLKSKSFLENLVYGCGPLLLFNLVVMCLTGMLIWILESVSHDSIFPRSFLKGFPEGIWWSFVTMSTVGYGDRIPMTYGGRLLTFLWMLSGTVMFTLLISYISTGLAVASLGNNIKLYGSKVAALQDTPEYRLGIRRNAQMNTGRNYTRLEDIRQDLLRGVVKGALIDSYVAAERKDLFDDPALYIHQLIYYRSSFGMVLSGNSTRLQHCFLDYLVKKRSLMTNLVKNYTKTLPSTTLSAAEEKSSDLLSNSKDKLNTVLSFLALMTAAAMVSGIAYDLVMRRRRKRRLAPNDESTTKLRYRNELRQEMSQVVEDFHFAIRQRYTELRAEHRENERRLVRRFQGEGETKKCGARDGSALITTDLTGTVGGTSTS